MGTFDNFCNFATSFLCQFSTNCHCVSSSLFQLYSFWLCAAWLAETLVIGLCARYKPVIGFMWFSRDVNTLAQYLELLTIQWEFPSLERQTARLLQSNVISIYLSWRFIVSSIHVFYPQKYQSKAIRDTACFQGIVAPRKANRPQGKKGAQERKRNTK